MFTHRNLLKIKDIDLYTKFIYLYIFLTPWHFFKSQTFLFSLILFIWAIYKFRKKLYKMIFESLKFLPILLFTLFIFYKVISSLWSEEIIIGLKHVLNYSKYLFLFLPIIFISLNRDNAIKAIKILIISFSIYSVYSISIYLNIIDIIGSSTTNPKGHLRYLVVSQYMAIGFFGSFLIAYFSKSNKEKLFFCITSILCIIALFLNNSRTAQVSFFVVLILILVFLMKGKFNKKIFLIFFSIFIISLSIFFYNSKFDRYIFAYSEAKSMIEKNEVKGSFGLRLYFNKVGLEILSENFLIGTGPIDNRELLTKYQENDPNYKNRIIGHYHSEHLDTLTAYGLIGYGLLFSAIVSLIYLLRHMGLYYYLSLSVFFTLFFNSFANKTLSVKTLNYIYILFFILFAIIAYKTEEDKKAKIENNS